MNLHDMVMYAWYSLREKFRAMQPKRPAKKRPKSLLPKPQALGMDLEGPIPPQKLAPMKARKGSEPPEPEIRMWTRDDLPELEDIMQGEGQGSITFDSTMLENAVKGSGLFGLVALRERRIVGLLVASEGTLIHVAVRENDKRTGVGKALWNAFLGVLQAGTSISMKIQVRDNNLPAHCFFRKMRFVCTVMLLDSIEGSDDAIYMMMFPKPPKWKIGTLHIVDGEARRTIYKPYPKNKK